MEIKRKFLKRVDWLGVTESRFAFHEFNGGVVALMELTKLKNPIIAEFRGETLKIADDGYFWLQVAPEGENFWITVMIDRRGNIIQYYFDVTEKNVIWGEDSHFYDLFLDLVAMPDGRLITLDEDELEEALAEGVVSREKFAFAQGVLLRLKNEIPERYGEMNDFCFAWFWELRERLK